jgi:hypothetical protein
MWKIVELKLSLHNRNFANNTDLLQKSKPEEVEETIRAQEEG